MVLNLARIKGAFYLFLAGMLALVTGCRPADDPAPLRVFAAASFGDAMAELAEAFEDRYGIPVELNLAGSNVLARQIASGARADVIISANRFWLDFLEERGQLLPGSRVTLLRNRLAVIQHASRPFQLDAIEDLAGLPFRFLAIGNPEAVPAGLYARQYLSSVPYGEDNLWQALLPRIAPAADVRRALALVAADPGVVGIVYRSDLSAAPQVALLFAVPADQVEISYQAALPVAGSAPETGALLLEFLVSTQARSVFSRLGFEQP